MTTQWNTTLPMTYIQSGQQSTFVKTIPTPHVNKRKLFVIAQEACRKDVKRAFGVNHHDGVAF